MCKDTEKHLTIIKWSLITVITKLNKGQMFLLYLHEVEKHDYSIMVYSIKTCHSSRLV